MADEEEREDEVTSKRLRPADAARALNLSKRELNRWVEDGLLTPETDEKGNRWYSKDEVDAMQSIAGSGKQQDATQVQWMKTLLEHEQKMVKMCLDAVGANQKLLSEENTSLRAERVKAHEVVEAALSLQTERDISMVQASKTEERRDKGLQLLGEVVQEIRGHIAGGSALSGFIRSLTDEQVTALRMSGLLKEEQVREFETLRQKLAAEKEKSSNGTSIPQ